MAALSRLGERARARAALAGHHGAAVSARSRLKDARTERKSLLRQLGEAVTLTETESIRARLDIVSREIEGARRDVRRVNNRAAFSTVAVTLVADRSAGGPARTPTTSGRRATRRRTRCGCSRSPRAWR